ncbi:MAG: hypothetical protein AAFY15_08385, partial [Cyanobacteria bacterium J06648_11]
MGLIKDRLEDQDLAIQRHVAGKGFPVDVIAKQIRNLGAGIFVQLLGEVRRALILARLVLVASARLLKVFP